MVEILQRGVKPSERTYTATCGNCGSQLRFKASEALRCFDQRDGDYLNIECPVCNQPVTVNVQAYDKPPPTRLGGWKD